MIPLHLLFQLLENFLFFLYNVFWILSYSILTMPLCPYYLIYKLLQSSFKWSPRFQTPPIFQMILNITATLIFLKYHFHHVTHLSTKSGENAPIILRTFIIVPMQVSKLLFIYTLSLVKEICSLFQHTEQPVSLFPNIVIWSDYYIFTLYCNMCNGYSILQYI